MKFLEKIIKEIKSQKHNLYREAFVHKSYAFENKIPYSYERLEFIGDTVINLAVSHYLFINYPEMSEGKMTSLRSKAIREHTLAKIAGELKFNNYLYLGIGEKKDEGWKKKSILSDVFEAFIGVLFLKEGYEFVFKFLSQNLFRLIKENKLNRIINHKTKLQEFLQKHEFRPSIRYKLTQEKKKLKYIDLIVNGIKICSANALTRKEAEQIAAKIALKKYFLQGENKKKTTRKK